MFLIALLKPLLTIAGAGAAAYQLINYARAYWTTPPANPVARVLYNVTHAPSYTRFTAYVLSVAISLFAAGLLALISGQPIGAALHIAASEALGAAWFSQMLHGAKLDNMTPHDREQQRLDAEARSMAAQTLSGSATPLRFAGDGTARTIYALPPRVPVEPGQATDGQPGPLQLEPGYTIERRLSPDEIREILDARKRRT